MRVQVRVQVRVQCGAPADGEVVAVEQRQTLPADAARHPVCAEHRVQRGLERAPVQVGERAAELVDVVSHALVEVVEALAAQRGCAVVARTVAVALVHVVRQPLAEAHRQQVGVELERGVDDAGHEASQAKVEQAACKARERPVHDRFDALAAAARDAQGEQRTAQQRERLRQEDRGLRRAPARHDDLQDRRQPPGKMSIHRRGKLGSTIARLALLRRLLVF